MSENKWLKYEQEKKKLLEKNLCPKDYENAIKELARRLGI